MNTMEKYGIKHSGIEILRIRSKRSREGKPMNLSSGLNNEEGSVLVISLVMLVLLTLMGIYAATTTEIELQIAGNERIYKRNLYTAESAAMECAQNMETVPTLDSALITWLNPINSITRDNARDNNFWVTDTTNPAVNSSEATVDDPDNNAEFMAVDQGIAVSSSLDMTKSNVHEYLIYGRWRDAGRPQEGRGLIAIGYRRAF